MLTTTSLSNHRIIKGGRVAPRAAMTRCGNASTADASFRCASIAEDARRTTTRRGSVVTRAADAAAAEGNPSNSASGKGGFDFGARARAIAFFLTSFSLAVPLITIMAIMFPFVWVFDRTRRSALSFCNDIWATVSTGLFFPVEVFGRANLPAADEAAVYVANHASFLDIYSLFHLRRPFKFISKTSNFLIPVVGWSMFLTGHVPLKRMERRSQMETLKKCREMLADGGSVLFFPEGTRSVDGKMAAFKKGAFSVAAKENVPVIPITLVGAHEAMASGKEYELHNGGIKVIIHPRIQSTNADELCDKAEKIIKEALVNNS
jgi:1-acyl-sn-glycerol-3-phosphate acyltransferase